MAQTKVKLISDGVIVQGNLHASHGITTAHIGEGSNLYYTDARVGSYLSTNSFATESYVGTQIANLVDSSPSALNTLNELAAALGDDANFSTTVTNSIALKAPLASPSFTGNSTFAGNVTVGNNGNINIPTAASGNANLNFDGTDFKITSNSSTANLKLETNSTTRLTINSGGKVIFGVSGGTITTIGSDIAMTQGAIGLRINDAASSISPTTATSNNDNAVDLGVSNIRFRNLYMGGNINFGDSHFIGDDADDNLLIQSSANENIIINSVDDLFLRTGGTTKLIVKNGGNVGIGTASPSAKLHITEQAESNYFIKLTGTLGTGNTYGFKTNGGNSQVLSLYDVTSTNRLAVFGDTEIQLATGGTSRLYIGSSGNVGIGTTSPGSKLEVKTSGANSTVELDNSDTNYTLIQYNAQGATKGFSGFNAGFMLFGGESGTTTRLQSGGSYAATILENGNFGIGTTSPGDKLHVDGGVIIQNGNNLQWGGLYSAGNPTIYASTNYLHFVPTGVTGSSSRQMRLNETGLGIGTSSPGAKLDLGPAGGIKQYVYSDGGNVRMGFGVDLSGSSRELSIFHPSSNGSNGDISFGHRLESNGTYYEKMRITGAGNLGIGTTSPNVRTEIKANVNGNPVTSGQTQTNGALRVRGSATNVLDIGQQSAAPYGMWMQVCEATSLGVSYPLLLNPNGGNVGIGATSTSSKLKVVGPNTSSNPLVDLVASGTGSFQRGVRLLNGGMNVGDEIMYAVGRSDNSRNMGQTYFYYAGDGSTSNRISMGLHSVDDVFNILGTGNVGIGTTSPTTKCWVKDSQDSSLFSGLGVERSANTTGVCLNAVGGALNLNTNSSMPLKFRIQNTSMQTINTDGGRAYAGFGGWRMFEYSYTVSVGNGATVDLFQNTSAHSDLHMVQIAIRMYHSGRTYFVGSGTVGGYGMNITGSGSGATNGGLTSAVVSSGIRKLQISQSSGFTAQATIYIQFRLDSGSGINVLNGTLSSL